jgi:hypothetical protein
MQGQLIWVQIPTRRAYKMNVKSYYGTSSLTCEVHWFCICWEQEAEENIFISEMSCVMRSSTICTLHHMLWEWLNQEASCGRTLAYMGGVRNAYRILNGIPEWKRPWHKWEGDLSSHFVSQCSPAAYKNHVLSHKKYLTTRIVVVWLFRSSGPRRFCGGFTECRTASVV